MSRRWRGFVATVARGSSRESRVATGDRAVRKWWNRMLQTKAVAALKGKGKKLMPGEHNKAW